MRLSLDCHINCWLDAWNLNLSRELGLGIFSGSHQNTGYLEQWGVWDPLRVTGRVRRGLRKEVYSGSNIAPACGQGLDWWLIKGKEESWKFHPLTTVSPHLILRCYFHTASSSNRFSSVFTIVMQYRFLEKWKVPLFSNALACTSSPLQREHQYLAKRKGEKGKPMCLSRTLSTKLNHNFYCTNL